MSSRTIGLKLLLIQTKTQILTYYQSIVGVSFLSEDKFYLGYNFLVVLQERVWLLLKYFSLAPGDYWSGDSQGIQLLHYSMLKVFQSYINSGVRGGTVSIIKSRKTGGLTEDGDRFIKLSIQQNVWTAD